jgi:DNA-binding transcriptional regulator YiaG
MRYFYDQATDSFYLTLADRKYADSVEAAPGVVLDFDSAGRLIGIDLEHASKTIDVADISLYAEPRQSEAPETKINGAELKRQREALGLSQVQLGRHLAVAANTIARWERGELKVEHPGMLSLALEALRQKNGGLSQRATPPPLPRQTRTSSLLKRKSRSAQGLLSSTRRSRSPLERAKRK